MRRIFTLFSTALLCAASAAAQTQINLATQANWNSLTGYGAPAGGTCPVTATGALTAGSFTTTLSSSAGILANQAVLGTGVASGTLVSAINTTGVVTVSKAFTTTGSSVSLRFYSYGQPYTDLTNNVQYVCAASGWVKQATSSSVYPASGIANSTGSAWGTSYGTTGTGTTVVLSANPAFTGTLAVNSAPTYSVGIAPLSAMTASWNFDTTTASSAFNSLGQSAVTTDGTFIYLPSVLSAACLGTDSAGKIGAGTCGLSGLAVGTTLVSGGTGGHVLYNNAGVLGDVATTGSGSVVQASGATLSGVTLTGITTLGAMYPASAGTYNLGTSTLTWANLYLSGAVSASELGQPASNTYAGSCAVSGTNVCTFTLSHSFTAPLCFPGGTVPIAYCTVSGTTVTVFAQAESTGVLYGLVVGNPN